VHHWEYMQCTCLLLCSPSARGTHYECCSWGG
jgi:hypothetical protein